MNPERSAKIRIKKDTQGYEQRARQSRGRHETSNTWLRRVLFIAGFCLVLIIGQSYTLLSYFEPRRKPLDDQPDAFVDPDFEGWLSTLGVALVVTGTHATKGFSDVGVRALRETGGWGGQVFLVTDQPDCFQEVASRYNTEIIEVPPVQSDAESVGLRCKLLEMLPSHVRTVLYLNQDVLATKTVEDFLRRTHESLLAPSSLEASRWTLQQEQENIPVLDRSRQGGGWELEAAPRHVRGGAGHHRALASKTAQAKLGPVGEEGGPQLALFQDAAGHSFGLCSGCDRWHAGAILMIKGVSEHCLSNWLKLIESNRFGSHQEALDHLVGDRTSRCKNILTLPSKDLLFMRDYASYMFGKKRTFSRFSGIEHLSAMFSKDWLYWKIVIMPTLHVLNMKGSDLSVDKTCGKSGKHI